MDQYSSYRIPKFADYPVGTLDPASLIMIPLQDDGKYGSRSAILELAE